MCHPFLCNTAPKQIVAVLLSLLALNLAFWLWAEPTVREFLLESRRSRDWIQNWPVSYGVVIFLAWGLFTSFVVFIWYLIIGLYPLRVGTSTQFLTNKQLNSSEEVSRRATETGKYIVNDKVRKTLGIEDSNQIGSINKTQVVLNEKTKLTENQSKTPRINTNSLPPESIREKTGRNFPSSLNLPKVTSLPACNSDTIVTIFKFDDPDIEENGILQNYPPFQDSLQLVHVDSPRSPTPRVVNVIEKEKKRMSAYRKKLQKVEVPEETEVEDEKETQQKTREAAREVSDEAEMENGKEKQQKTTETVREFPEEAEVEDGKKMQKEARETRRQFPEGTEMEDKKEAQGEETEEEGTFWTTPTVLRKGLGQNADLDARRCQFGTRTSVMLANVTDGQINDVIMPGKCQVLSDPAQFRRYSTMIP